MQPFEFDGDWSGQLIATAIHAGHELRPEVAELMALDEDVRFREEDPHTDRIASLAPARVVVHQSRFETDLNRPRSEAVYRTPDDAWGLDLWTEDELPDDIVARSLDLYDSFYAALADRLDEVAARGPFVLLDVHSYNHRRHGPDAPHEPDRGESRGQPRHRDDRRRGSRESSTRSAARCRTRASTCGRT